MLQRWRLYSTRFDGIDIRDFEFGFSFFGGALLLFVHLPHFDDFHRSSIRSEFESSSSVAANGSHALSSLHALASDATATAHATLVLLNQQM